MNQIIVTTPEELRAIVSETVSQTLAGLNHTQKELPDNLTPDAAVEALEQHGFLISKARCINLRQRVKFHSASMVTNFSFRVRSFFRGLIISPAE